MKYMEGKKVDPKKKNTIRRRYCIVCMIIAFASATVMWELYNYKIWNEHTQVVKQIILVGGLYTFTYWFFVKMYQGHKIGVYRLTELAYFQLLSYGMADAFMVLASMFWFRKISIKFIVIALIMLVAQIGINGVCIFISNRAWMQYDEPQKIVIIYGDEGYLSIVRKMKIKPYRYNIQQCYSDTASMEEITQAILACDRVYLYRVNETMRYKLVLYCNAICKDIYLSREIEELITMGYDISHSFDTPFIRTSRG